MMAIIEHQVKLCNAAKSIEESTNRCRRKCVLEAAETDIFTALLANYFSIASWEILLQYDLLSFTWHISLSELSTCPAKDEIFFLDTLLPTRIGKCANLVNADPPRFICNVA
jgi:hypothetical protein